MKKFLFLFAWTAICAQEGDRPSENLWDYHPIHGGGNVLAIGKADVIPKNMSQDGELTFNKANAFLYMLLPISRYSYFFPRVEWNTFSMDWNKNPKFHETRFNYIQFALTFFTIGIEKWRWIMRGEYNVDVKHFSHWGSYGLFSGLLWGTHEMHRKWHFHIGALGYTGFEGEMVYPVIGLDFAPNKKWKFQAVFPITYSVEYSLTKEWQISLKGRPLKERFRADRFEPQPQSVFCYASTGFEFNIHYEKFLRVDAEAFIGYNFGGKFYIKDRDGHHPLYTHVQGAPYIGANLNWGF